MNFDLFLSKSMISGFQQQTWYLLRGKRKDPPPQILHLGRKVIKYFPRYHPSCSLRSLSRTLKGTNLAAFTASSGSGKTCPSYRFTPATGSLKRFKIVVSVIASYLSSAIIASCIPKSKRILMHWLQWIFIR